VIVGKLVAGVVLLAAVQQTADVVVVVVVGVAQFARLGARTSNSTSARCH
jgi:hypothetical protein